MQITLRTINGITTYGSCFIKDARRIDRSQKFWIFEVRMGLLNGENLWQGRLQKRIIPEQSGYILTQREDTARYNECSN